MELGLSKEDRHVGNTAYRRFNDSQMQRRLRNECVWMIGTVYWQPGDYDPDILRNELVHMRELGFNMVRFHTAFPEEIGPGEYDFSRTDAWLDLAVDAGLKVVLAVRSHEHDVGARTLEKHGLDREAYLRAYADDPGFLAVLEDFFGAIAEHCGRHPGLCAWGGLGEPDPGDPHLSSDEDRYRFGQWLRRRYGTLGALDKAWNPYPEKGRRIVESFDTAWRLLEPIRFRYGVAICVRRSTMVYGAIRDLERFLTEKALDRTRAIVEAIHRHDAEHPVLVGSHVFLANQAAWRFDHFARGRLGDGHTCSVHLSWNQQLVRGEIDRPLYMQVRMARDAFKAGWTGAFETTGGPVQYSGGYGNHMDPGLMRRLCLIYLAAGHRNIAFWTWNSRPGGWEAGEYGLTSLSGTVTPWAREAAKVAHAIERFRLELRDADPEPQAAVLVDWDTDAILTCEPEQQDPNAGENPHADGTVHEAVRARIGACRALLNHHVPFEFLASSEILEEPRLTLRYPAIIAPHLRAISEDVLIALRRHVERGGTLIADVQFGFMDPCGKLRRTGPGSAREQLFGGYIDAIHHTRTTVRSVNGIEIDGFYGDLIPTTTRVLACFDDGSAAVTERRLGRGCGVLFGFDIARMCLEPGNTDLETLLAEAATTPNPPGWRCNAPLAFRLSSPPADHYFLINDSPSDMTAWLHVYDRRYRTGLAVLEDEAVPVDGVIAVPIGRRSGTWLRLELLQKSPGFL